MHVAIEARALAAPGGGVRRYVAELVRQLPHQSSADTFATLDHGPSGALLLPWWMNVSVPRWLHQVKPDLVHFTKAAIPTRKTLPTVVTIYDVIPILFPESQKFPGRLYWPRALKHAAQASDHILTISEASKRDIVDQLNVPHGKVTVTPLAVDASIFHPTPASDLVRRVSGGAPYILFVGTIEPRKNVSLLIRSFARIAREVPHRLFIAGRVYKGAAELTRAIAASGLPDRITRLPFVPAAELAALYSNADLGVWPSVYEGWGFPPQEAMACGAPVIVSDGASLPEVVREAGVIVPFSAPLRERTADTDFEQRLAAAMRDVLHSPEKRSAMRAAGLERVKEFSWRRVVEQTLIVYRQLA